MAPRQVDNSAQIEITRVIVHGARGRTGSRVAALARADASFELVAALARDRGDAGDAADAPRTIGDEARTIAHDRRAFAPSSAHVVIDFSSDEGARAALRIAEESGAALLVGTTALSTATLELLRGASKKKSVLVAPNTSFGVPALAGTVAALARALGPGFRASIVEAHHAMKKDAPSGTALRLAAAVRDAGGDLPRDQVLSIRAGDTVGEHTVRFAGPGEVLELTHRATSRDVFAAGALRAAAWLRGRAPGWWTMEDVLGLRGDAT